MANKIYINKYKQVIKLLNEQSLDMNTILIKHIAQAKKLRLKDKLYKNLVKQPAQIDELIVDHNLR